MITRDDHVQHTDAPTLSRADDGVQARTLTTKQREMLAAIDHYWRSTGEPCPGRYLARRFRLHHKTVQEHVRTLGTRGWLRGKNPPAVPAREWK